MGSDALGSGRGDGEGRACEGKGLSMVEAPEADRELLVFHRRVIERHPVTTQNNSGWPRTPGRSTAVSALRGPAQPTLAVLPLSILLLMLVCYVVIR